MAVTLDAVTLPQGRSVHRLLRGAFAIAKRDCVYSTHQIEMTFLIPVSCPDSSLRRGPYLRHADAFNAAV